ncbi:S-adenosylmethionine-dependent methyltransferase [Chloropicon primus]|uniref:S-adenosylmethionine-dependent methyltransferase n=3 Tax=Chloropicon primus TaxID=1764295 RepID=A0A5B8MJD9_9CHLO|nr:S-adenosylmethionine-dependent methyltransferase [Chloropicon primus]UPQ99740.1 S-adenosylmethionine-dependent methyltransferase [Chloropicon primus]|eukprot:QDZ20529.1 S-adenosylmethionine-dependent methyltransferase [Chloropicon primus]
MTSRAWLRRSCGSSVWRRVPSSECRPRRGGLCLWATPSLREEAVLVRRRGLVVSAGGGGRTTEGVGEGEGKKASLPCAVLKKGKVNLFEQNRNPIIYGGAVERVEEGEGPGLDPGKPVFFSDWKRRLLGWGFYNPTSMYRCRIMEFASDASFREDLSAERIESFLVERVREAIEARARVGLPSAHTDVYRLVNSEGDNLSGLVVDKFGSSLVVQSSGAWVERHKAVIMKALASAVDGSDTIAWRSDVGILKKEGLDVDADLELFQVHRADEGISLREGGDDASRKVTVTENGAAFAVRIDMQKTGFYCDQRANRSFVKKVAKGKSCLDLCCYTGGFAVAAAIGGASSVTGVDSSSTAIEMANENAKLNGVDAEFVEDDISKFMSKHIERGDEWDLVVLDPPKLCPSAKFMKQATRKYEKLNMMAMQLVAKGGVLVTCSCSGAMTRGNAFVPMLTRAAARVGRDVKVVRLAGAAEDHMTSLRYPEGEYLSVVTLIVS